jgi:hypothetical protein
MNSEKSAATYRKFNNPGNEQYTNETHFEIFEFLRERLLKIQI